MIYYLPGCDVAANHPEAIARLRAYLLSQEGVREAPCCRRDLGVLEPGDTVVQNCTLCQLMLAERVPEVTVTSLYEHVLADGSFPWPDFSGRTVALQDCFRTRRDARLQDAVRACLTRMGMAFLEMPERRESSRFCGVWLMNPAAKDCPPLAPRTFAELDRVREVLPARDQEERMRAWAEGYPTDEVAVYCNGCERGVRMGGKRPLHMVELLAAGM